MRYIRPSNLLRTAAFTLLAASAFLSHGLTQTARPPIIPADPPRLQPGPRLALLVGINRYKDERMRALTGCENDVRLMQQTLTNDFGFLPANVVPLTGTGAGRESIIRAFKTHLIGGAKAARERNQEAVVVFHFSGHGSRLPDQDGDEKDSWDETLVPYDSRTAGVFDIRDDEIQDLLIELSQYTANVTFILDSCHSGTGTRGELEAREVRDDDRPQPTYTRKFRLSDEQLAGKYMTISAALPHQRAYGRPPAVAAEPNGALTFHLVAALRRASRQTSYRALIDGVAPAVRNEIQFQDPQVEGDINRLVFGGSAQRAEPYVGIDEVRDGVVTFRAGRAHGVKVGAQVSIYAAGTLEHVGTKGWLTNATVNVVSDFVAMATLPPAAENPKVKEVSASSHVILASPNFGGGPVLLSLNHRSLSARGAAAEGFRTAVRLRIEDRLLVANQLLEFVEDAPDGQVAGVLQLKYGRFDQAFERPATAAREPTCVGNVVGRPAPATEGYYLDDGGSVPLFGIFVRADDATAAAKIADALSAYVKQRNLRVLENDASPLKSAVKVTLQVFPGTLSYLCQDGRTRPDFAESGPPRVLTKAVLPLRVVYNLKIENVSGEPLHVTAVLLSNDGNVRIIYPLFSENEPLANPRAAMQNTKVAETRRLATSTPAGRETIKLIVTREWSDFAFLEKPDALRGPRSLFQRLLSQSGIKMRGEPLPPDDPASWGVVTFNLDIKDEAPDAL